MKERELSDREQFERTSKILQDLVDNEFEVKAVQWREKADLGSQVTDFRNDYLSTLAIASIGYKTLIEAYSDITNIPMVQTPKRNDLLSLKKVNSYLDEVSEISDKILNAADRQDSSKISNLAKELSKKLEDTGEIILPDSVAEHHAVSKYTKDSTGQYYKTSYNAGYGAETPDSNDSSKVYGVTKQLVKSNVTDDIEEMLSAQLLQKSSLQGPKKPLEKNLGNPSQDSIIVASQRSHNCSTRTIREMLRDNLPTDHFRNLYDTVTNTAYEDLRSTLEAKKAELGKKLGINTQVSYENAEYSKSIESENYRLALQYAINKNLNLPIQTPVQEMDSIAKLLDIMKYCQDDKSKSYMVGKIAQTLTMKNIVSKDAVSNSSVTNVANYDEGTTHTIRQYFMEGHTDESKKIMLNIITDSVCKSLRDSFSPRNIGGYLYKSRGIKGLDAFNMIDAITKMLSRENPNHLETEMHQILMDTIDKKALLTATSLPQITEHLQNAIAESVVSHVGILNLSSFSNPPSLKQEDSISSYVSSHRDEIVESLKSRISLDKTIKDPIVDIDGSSRRNTNVRKIVFNELDNETPEKESIPKYPASIQKEFKEALMHPDNAFLKEVIETSLRELNIHEGKISKADGATLNALLGMLNFPKEGPMDQDIVRAASKNCEQIEYMAEEEKTIYKQMTSSMIKEAIEKTRQAALLKELSEIKGKIDSVGNTNLVKPNKDLVREIGRKVARYDHDSALTRHSSNIVR